MYQILLLHEMTESGRRISDYLRLAGYKVTEERIDLFRFEGKHIRFDMILLESERLEMRIQICEKLRKRIQIPIVVLSGKRDEWEIIQLFQMGIDDYMVKPYWQGEFMARIQAHIERYKRLTEPQGIVRVNDIEINAFSRSVQKDGKLIDLRLKEFDVLLYMVQHPNQVLTKEEIYEAVWKDDLGEGFFNSVAVHIKRIRSKIEEDESNPQYIETVWGVGYRFNVWL